MPNAILTRQAGKFVLCAAFAMAGSGISGSAHALSGKDRPKMRDGISLPDGTATPSLSCVQQAAGRHAVRSGYTDLTTMRRAAALARIWGDEPVSAIAAASLETGIDFDLLIMKALIESRMGQFDQPHLGGNARGLFHFMPATWLTLFSWFGHEYQGGIYAEPARAIKFDDTKNPFTDNPALTEMLQALRSDHYVAAYIKAKSVRHDERPLLKAILGREPTYTDYYVAHFLGLERSKTFFRALRKSPNAAAAGIFQRESEDPNNRPLFYRGNKKLSILQVYNKIGGMVTGTLRRIDNSIAAELKQNKCTPVLIPMRPARDPFVMPAPPESPLDLPPEGPRPPIPPENSPPEGPPLPPPRPDDDTDPATTTEPSPPPVPE